MIYLLSASVCTLNESIALILFLLSVHIEIGLIALFVTVIQTLINLFGVLEFENAGGKKLMKKILFTGGSGVCGVAKNTIWFVDDRNNVRCCEAPWGFDTLPLRNYQVSNNAGFFNREEVLPLSSFIYFGVIFLAKGKRSKVLLIYNENWPRGDPIKRNKDCSELLELYFEVLTIKVNSYIIVIRCMVIFERSYVFNEKVVYTYS